jgi:arsenate reductase
VSCRAITIYGIKNCDTMKKARAWLEQHRVAYDFPRLQDRRHRARQAGGLGKKAGWETLLNRAGTTFRALPDKDKAGLTEKKAIALMLDQPSMIKRPVLELSGGRLLVGFKPEPTATPFADSARPNIQNASLSWRWFRPAGRLPRLRRFRPELLLIFGAAPRRVPARLASDSPGAHHSPCRSTRIRSCVGRVHQGAVVRLVLCVLAIRPARALASSGGARPMGLGRLPQLFFCCAALPARCSPSAPASAR